MQAKTNQIGDKKESPPNKKRFKVRASDIGVVFMLFPTWVTFYIFWFAYQWIRLGIRQFKEVDGKDVLNDYLNRRQWFALAALCIASWCWNTHSHNSPLNSSTQVTQILLYSIFDVSSQYDHHFRTHESMTINQK